MMQPTKNLIERDLMERIIDDPIARREMAKALLGFKLLYLPHYLTLPPSSFQSEMGSLFENWVFQFLAIIGFRGSAKSTNASLALPLWAALEKKAEFIIIIRDTDAQARLDIANIRHELENNEVLKMDYGDQSEGISKIREWTQHNLLFTNGTRIMSRSRGQRIRGLRHRQYRPDLVIIDDPEDREKVKKKEYRDNTEHWLRSEVIPAIEETNARLIVIGNVLHTDALMARLKNDPIFLHKEYPLINTEGNVTWRAKYPTAEALKRQEQKVGRTAWLREYLLKVVPPEGQEVKEEWIQKYEKLPEGIMASGVGVDFAISKKETADFTAMVSGVSALVEGIPKIFILPNPVNERLSFHETKQQALSLYKAMGIYAPPIFFPEKVGYQQAAIEEFQRAMIPVEPMQAGQDKRARLRTAATLIQNSTVLFPQKGAEDLIDQLVNFGVTDHDDLMDAFCYLIFGLSRGGLEMPEVIGLL